MKFTIWLYFVLIFFFFFEHILKTIFWAPLIIYLQDYYIRHKYRWMCERNNVLLYTILQWRARGKSTWTGPITGRLPRCEKMLSHNVIYVKISTLISTPVAVLTSHTNWLRYIIYIYAVRPTWFVLVNNFFSNTLFPRC
jgi:hypothetical protein